MSESAGFLEQMAGIKKLANEILIASSLYI